MSKLRAALRLLILPSALLPALAFAQFGSLVVTMTEPDSGATVSGSIPVSARVTIIGAATVVGVQFELDGANLGAEDGSAPYSVTWNTAGAANGSHTLTAVARDFFGVHYTSQPVTVTVANAPPPPPPPPSAARRFEESDQAVAFSAGWSAAPSRTWSAGGAAATAVPGAQATFTFTGTSVAWVGGRATGTGIARVSVDGVFVAEVDTYSRTEEIRVSMFGISGLASGSHTLTIEAAGRMNPEAVGTLIVVDAFDVPAPATSRLQDTDPSIVYGVGWMAGDPSRAWSGGTATLSAIAGAQATLTFNGTAVSWIGARGPQTGIARVSVDGAAAVEVDTYATSEQIQAAIFTATNLADTAHTLTIQATGMQNAAAGNVVVIDGFEVTAPGSRVQETTPAIVYSAGWIPDNRDKAYSEGISAESNTVGAQASFTFFGTGVRWIGARGPQTGMARVFLDGAPVADIDTYALTEGPQHTDFAVTGLARTTHTLTIQITGKNPAAYNAWILIDAFDVLP